MLPAARASRDRRSSAPYRSIPSSRCALVLNSARIVTSGDVLSPRFASVIVDRTAFGISASWTQRSVRRLVQLKR